MLAVVASLTRRDFFKSMTTYADHLVWQDAYHAQTPVGKTAYIKITLHDTASVIQFKEKFGWPKPARSATADSRWRASMARRS
jgi:motility quorum-sensing regulator/GCU-specific mRNA interferase toxin